MKKKMSGKQAAVGIANRSKLAGAQRLKLAQSCAKKAASLLSLKGELSLAFVDDSEMRKLNLTYRNIPRTTDVLAFEQNSEKLAGDVVISFETAARRAARYGITVEEEIKRLVVHGIAHLAGYNHKRKKEGEKMRAEEKKILRAIANL